MKKPSVRKLQAELKSLHLLNDALRTNEQRLNIKNKELEQRLQARLDTSMLDQRIRLANSLGQMIEATSKAVMYIVAKETI